MIKSYQLFTEDQIIKRSETMRKMASILVVLLLVLLASCSSESTIDQRPQQELTPMPSHTTMPMATPTFTPEPPSPLTLEESAEAVINALAEKDLQAVAEFVHPEQGVRFSPYTYVEESHQVFTVEELASLPGSEEIFSWGNFDGTGDPIELTFDDYYQRFIYSADFANPEQMAVDEELGYSSMINNIADFYPGSSFVEYHFSGFVEDYGGMDWVSLRLVFIEEDGTWFLVGIVHDQWTI
jgi:hypothetical protein